MEFEGIVYDLISKAKQNKKKIVLPEAEDVRVLTAASYIQKENIAEVVLVGSEDRIRKVAKDNNIDIENIHIENPTKSSKYEEYVEEFFNLRKHKGVTLEGAKEILKDEVYFATMMVKQGQADGMVSGAIHSTADTLRPALQIVKQKEGVNTVSSFFLIETKNKNLGENGIFIFSDCGLIESPTEDQLVDISISSAESFREIVRKEPKLALLSYSTKGSAKSPMIDKVVGAYKKLNELNVDFDFDGELQLDAAIIPEVAKLKAPDSKVAGYANILVFPNLEAGNIGYKLTQRFGDAVALGPITQGLKKPINDLSRGCSAKDIVGAVAITCLQAK